MEYITELCSIEVYNYQKFNPYNYDRYIVIIMIKYSIASSLQDLKLFQILVISVKCFLFVVG